MGSTDDGGHDADMLIVTLVVAFSIVGPGEKPQDASTPTTTVSDDTIPAGMQQFGGILVGRLTQKDVERGTFSVRVDRVSNVKRYNKSKNPKSVIGRRIAVEGVSGKWLDVLLLIRLGETCEFECRHIQGNRLTFVPETMRKVPPVKPGEYPDLAEKFRGFEGVVVARIVKKDDEILELIVKVEMVKETWKGNRAGNPKSIVGNRVMLDGFGAHKATYHKLKVGDVIEAGARHLSPPSEHLTVARFIRPVAEPIESDR